jgi:hypothetical protein
MSDVDANGKQFHFTVFWDHDTAKWTVDNETCVAVMPDGTVYDRDAENWMILPEELESYDQARYSDLVERLR